MSDTFQTVPEVISIEEDDNDDDDGDDADVEVVFTKINKSHVYRNLMCQKISQEIELLQIMCKQTVPSDFDQFKKKAKESGFQYGDDVIQSAWQRILKRYLTKLSSFPTKKAPVCLVGPFRPSVDVSPSQAYAPLSSPHSFSTVTSSSNPIPSSAVPVALLMNKAVHIANSPHQRLECLMKPTTLFKTIEIDTDDENSQANADDSANKQGISESEKNNSAVSASKNVFPSVKKYSKKRKCETNISCTDLNKQDLSTSELEKSDDIQNSLVGALSQFFDSVVSEKTQCSEKKPVKRKSSQKHKCSTVEVVSVDSPKTVGHAVAKSHIGVKAKIVRTKQTSPTNCRKRLSKPIKEMSEAELKEFKAEQKRLKYEQKHEFEMQQLQKVHDRLVDVLIPKYYSKALKNIG